MRRLKFLSPAVLTGFIGLFWVHAFAFDLKNWEVSIDRQTNARYIPVELWAGAEWDGKRELKMPPVDGTYRHHNATYRIKGPVEWVHPVMRQTFVVYERLNPGRERVKTQRFTINQEKNGLGRVFDDRSQLGTRMGLSGKIAQVV